LQDSKTLALAVASVQFSKISLLALAGRKAVAWNIRGISGLNTSNPLKKLTQMRVCDFLNFLKFFI